MSDIKRLRKELDDIQKNDIPNLSAGPINDNLFEWNAVILGPVGTPYEGGVFNLNISIPSNYPFKPPIVIFKTKIYHPNISENGIICLDVLKDQWSPALSIYKILLSIQSLLTDPNPDSPLNGSAAQLYRSDRREYRKMCQKYIKDYAS